MSRSLSHRLHYSHTRRARLFRWVGAIAFVIVMAASGVRHVYAHDHSQMQGSVSTSEGMIPLTMHLQQDAHEGTSPNQGQHFHDTGALAHSPAAVGPIVWNVSPVTERVLFADPTEPHAPILPERFLRPPAAH